MLESIDKYLEVVKETSKFTNFNEEIFNDVDAKELIFAGKSLEIFKGTPKECLREIERVSSISFDIEKGVSYYVYKNSRNYVQDLITKAKEISKDFSTISPEDVKENPYLLPVWQASLKVSSKSNLKEIFGSVSDHNISKPSSEKISNYANDFYKSNPISTVEITERMERTLEGIVRDLVGRVLLESVVQNALEKAKVPYVIESDYNGIDGVVYKFRADFVIPNAERPLAFIEVRKSSSRHASLYAKDKMFSAINWKGKHKNMIGIIVTEGSWTQETLSIMSNVFDYVVPLSDAETLANNIKKYIDGDDSILKWIINFSIDKNG